MNNDFDYSFLLKLIYKRNDNNINYDNNNNNDIIFFKVWRNKYIKSLITNENKLTFNSNKKIRFKNCQELYDYKLKDYLTNVILEDDEEFIRNILTPSITSLEFGLNFNQKLKINDIPPNIRILKLPALYSKSLENVIPNGVVELTLGKVPHNSGIINIIKYFKSIPSSITHLDLNGYDFMLPKDVIPQSVIKLNLGLKFNSTIEIGSLPSNLKELTVGNSFNKVINVDILPISLEKLKLGQRFNQKVENWSKLVNIKTLIFGNLFNNGGTLLNKNDLPPNLVELDLGNYFEKLNTNDHLFGCLFPQSLEKLKLNIINRPLVEGILPISLKRFETSYNLPILKKGDLPNQLLELILPYNYDYPLSNSIPSSVTYLEIRSAFNQQLLSTDLPSSLTSLKLGSSYNKQFPQFDKIRELIFGDTWNQIPCNLPSSLTRLTFGSRFNKEILDNHLPQSLTYLNLGHDFNFNLPLLPVSLITLIMGTRYNKPINGKLKHLTSLKNLKFSSDFNQPILLGDIPNSVCFLEFGLWFNQTILPNSLSSSLTEIKFGSRFDNGGLPFQLNSIPDGVKYIEFNKSFIPINLPNSIVSINNSFL